MPRPLEQQTVVITGATSGIGLTTAIALGRRGAQVVLAARSAEGLEHAVEQVEQAGGRAVGVPTDVADAAQVQALADRAVEAFGRIDTWVNGAGVSAYGRLEEIPVEEIRRVIDVDLMGQVHGIKAALPHLRSHGGGTLIAISSGLGARAVPLQGPYCASKAGVIALMDSLRMELEHDDAGVAVTTILPSSINTPLFEHAGSHLGVLPAPVPPIYQPQAVAEAILHAAEHPVRDIVVGGAGKALIVQHRLAPRATDRLLQVAGQAFARQRSSRPEAATTGNLFEPGIAGLTTGSHGRLAFGVSRYSRLLEHHPNRRRALVGASAVALVGWLRR